MLGLVAWISAPALVGCVSGEDTGADPPPADEPAADAFELLGIEGTWPIDSTPPETDVGQLAAMISSRITFEDVAGVPVTLAEKYSGVVPRRKWQTWTVSQGTTQLSEGYSDGSDDAPRAPIPFVVEGGPGPNGGANQPGKRPPAYHGAKMLEMTLQEFTSTQVDHRQHQEIRVGQTPVGQERWLGFAFRLFARNVDNKPNEGAILSQTWQNGSCSPPVSVSLRQHANGPGHADDTFDLVMGGMNQEAHNGSRRNDTEVDGGFRIAEAMGLKTTDWHTIVIRHRTDPSSDGGRTGVAELWVDGTLRNLPSISYKTRKDGQVVTVTASQAQGYLLGYPDYFECLPNRNPGRANIIHQSVGWYRLSNAKKDANGNYLPVYRPKFGAYFDEVSYGTSRAAVEPRQP